MERERDSDNSRNGYRIMIMEKEVYASALIYGRTYYRDYGSGFLLSPNDFSEEDIGWAYKYVSEAVSYCDELKGIRHVVFGNEKHLVFGIVGILNDFFTENLPDSELRQCQKYTFDGSGRNIKCFLGLVCHMEDKKKGMVFPTSGIDFIRPFLENLTKEETWYSREVLKCRCGYKYPLQMNAISDTWNLKEHMILSGKERDGEIFSQVLAENEYGCYISLCTNVYNLKMAEKEIFTYVTAEKNVLERYQKKMQQLSESSVEKKKKQQERESKSPKNGKKKDNAVILIGVVVLIIIVIVLLILI